MSSKPDFPRPRWHAWSAADLHRIIPDYEITELIGQGAMGAVYKARHLTMERIVAIKFLPKELEEENPRYVSSFEREAKIMAGLNHPGIARIFESGITSDGQRFLVMEYCAGSNLALILKERGALPWVEAVGIVQSLCLALDHAHRQGVVHRDLKPANVLITPSNQVKITDFGLACSLTDGVSSTAQGGGTPDYVAPEALNPGGKVDQRADIYALGVIL